MIVLLVYDHGRSDLTGVLFVDGAYFAATREPMRIENVAGEPREIEIALKIQGGVRAALRSAF